MRALYRGSRRFAFLTAAVALTACGLDVIGVGGAVERRDGGAAVSDAAVLDAEDSRSSAVDAAFDASDGKAPRDACAEGAVLFQRHCYFFEPTETTQPVAKEACAKRGGHLVTLTSVEEKRVAQAFGTGPRWIGLESGPNPPPDPAAYAWITGEVSRFSDWEPGNPDDGKSCVVMQGPSADHTWADRDCLATNPAVCEEEL